MSRIEYNLFETKNKFNFTVTMGYVELNEKRYIPCFCLSSFFYNPNLNWRKRLEKTREVIRHTMKKNDEDDMYNDLFVEGDILEFSYTDENTRDIHKALNEMDREHFERMFGKSKSSRGGNNVKYMLLSEEALRYLMAQFKFTWDLKTREKAEKQNKLAKKSQGRTRLKKDVSVIEKERINLMTLIEDELTKNEKYTVKEYQKYLYFTHWENVVKQVWDKNINFTEWTYLMATQIRDFIALRNDYFDTLMKEYNRFWLEDEKFRFHCKFASDDEDKRENSFRYLVNFHIENTYGNKNKLSYKAIKYSSLIAMEKELDKIKNNEIDVKELILNIITIYRELVNIVNYGGEKIFEQILVNNAKDETETKKDKSQSKMVRRNLIHLDNSKYFKSSLRYKVFNMNKVNNDFMNNYLPTMNENNEFDKLMNDSIVGKYLNFVEEYGNLNRRINYMEAFMQPLTENESNYSSKCKLKIYDSEDKQRHTKFGLTFAQNKEMYIDIPSLDRYCNSPQFDFEYEDYKLELLNNMLNTVDNWVEENKKELSLLRIERQKVENSLLKNGEYLKDYLRNEITLKKNIFDTFGIANVEGIFDDNYIMTDDMELKKVNLRKRHTNQLLEG